MQINPQRAHELSSALSTVLSKISSASSASSASVSKPSQVRLIAVSKLQPANDILSLHRNPHAQFHFGENYAQELIEKSRLLPSSIKWHFIGALQTNKCKSLAKEVRNLWCVSSVDSIKKADQLDKGRAECVSDNNNDTDDGGSKSDDKKLRVLVQVNTSGEEEKSGVEPSDAVNLCRHIRDECSNLTLAGLMTIGAIARSKDLSPETQNQDFEVLVSTRGRVAKALMIEEKELELSMGMSSDFESAIRQGSTEVRVGTGIFGQRPAKKDAVVKQDVKEGRD